MYHDMLKTFREDRRLTEYNANVQKRLVNEELDEALEAKTWNHRVEEMCDVCVLCFGALAQQGLIYTPDEFVVGSLKDLSAAVAYSRIRNEASTLNANYDAIIDNMRDCITLNGYDFDKAMIETCKKILSRKGAMNNETGKWEKDPMQDKSTLYVPDYESCKIDSNDGGVNV